MAKVSSGLIAYYACDNETSIPNKDPSDDLWWFRSDNSVRGNSTLTIIVEDVFDFDRSEASLAFSFSGEGVIYAWTYVGGPYYDVAPYIDLIVDGEVVARNPNIASVWTLLKAQVGSGAHTVELRAYAGWRNPSRPYQAHIGFDEIMVVKSRYINITGLKTGYKVIIVNVETGEVVYQGTASKNYLAINAEDIGITNFPMKARIIILRY